METVNPGFGEPVETWKNGELFLCPRCGYFRPLKHGEDAFRIYILHEQRCNPTFGEQIWLPFINEDDVISLPLDDERPLLLRSRLQPQAKWEQAGSTAGAARLHSRKAA